MMTKRYVHKWEVALGGALSAALLWGCAEEPPTGPDEFSASNSEMEAKSPKGRAGDVSVSAVDPDTVPTDTILTVRVLGSGFTAGSTVSWALAGTPTSAVTTQLPVTFVSARELQASIAVSRDAPLARYDAVVTVPGGKKGIGLEMLEVVAKPIELPVPKGYQTSTAMDVNDAGLIVGWGADQAGLGHALIWTPVGGGWAVEELAPPTAGPGTPTWGQAVNNSGYVVIQIWTPSNEGSRFVVRTPSGEYVPLGLSWVRDLNDQGTVIGHVTGQGPAVLLQTSSASWSGPIYLPGVAGWTSTDLNDINDHGDIVGRVEQPGSAYEWPVIWQFNGTGWSPPILVDQDPGAALAINNVLAVAGGHWPCVDFTCSSLPAFWAAPGATRELLPVVESRVGSGFVKDLNDGNRIVGTGRIRVGKRGASFMRPVVWTPGRAQPVDLGALLNNSSGEATAINNSWPAMVVGHVNSGGGANNATAWIVF